VKRIFLAITLLAVGCGQPSVDQPLTGGGSTFVKPLMEKWQSEYSAKGKVTYESVGSGEGVKRMDTGVYDFVCTDAALENSELEKLKKTGGELLHIPIILGAVVPAYNLDEVQEPLIFDGPTLAGMYLGMITRWNDKALKNLNPKIELPDKAITLIHRADNSGTTHVWTDYLSKISPEWKSNYGIASSLTKWPVGGSAMGNDGVTTKLKETAGGLAYLPLSYAYKGDFKIGLVKNKEGAAIKATTESVTAAAASALATMPDDLRYSLVDAPGKDSYPISGTTWAVVYVKQPAGKAKPLAQFLRWATHEGQAHAANLHYAQLPPGLVERLDKKLDQLNGNP
jgi:phosphate transport system substrate-binding protein